MLNSPAISTLNPNPALFDKKGHPTDALKEARRQYNLENGFKGVRNGVPTPFEELIDELGAAANLFVAERFRALTENDPTLEAQMAETAARSANMTPVSEEIREEEEAMWQIHEAEQAETDLEVRLLPYVLEEERQRREREEAEFDRAVTRLKHPSAALVELDKRLERELEKPAKKPTFPCGHSGCENKGNFVPSLPFMNETLGEHARARHLRLFARCGEHRDYALTDGDRWHHVKSTLWLMTRQR